LKEICNEIRSRDIPSDIRSYEQEAMNIAGQVVHDGDYHFDGMPEYKMNVRQVLNNKELDNDK